MLLENHFSELTALSYPTQWIKKKPVKSLTSRKNGIGVKQPVEKHLHNFYYYLKTLNNLYIYIYIHMYIFLNKNSLTE